MVVLLAVGNSRISVLAAVYAAQVTGLREERPFNVLKYSVVDVNSETLVLLFEYVD